MSDLTIKDLSETVIKRQHFFADYLNDETIHWDKEEWLIAMMSKIGEIADLMKMTKLKLYNSDDNMDYQIGYKLSDIIIYSIIFINKLKIEKPEDVIKNAFNNKSEELRCDIRI